MTRLAILALSALAALAVVAWLRRPQPEPDRAMDDVQSDPWQWQPFLMPDGSVRFTTDPTYLEATALAAIRRSGQSSDASTGGM